MTTRFEKAYNALVNAFFNGTLAKGDCICCAVGNIVADAQGGTVEIRPVGVMCDTNNAFWWRMFSSDSRGQFNDIISLPNLAKEIETLTGYTAHEMAKIEFAFETNTNIHLRDYPRHTEQQILEDQYNGLIAVVDVMLALDGMSNDGHKEKFKQHPRLVLA